VYIKLYIVCPIVKVDQLLEKSWQPVCALQHIKQNLSWAKIHGILRRQNKNCQNFCH